MLDRLTLKLAKPLLDKGAGLLRKAGITPDQVSIAGFAAGVLAVTAIALHYYSAALVLILVNRLADGLDGALARKYGATDSGAYLDICLDFLFYAGIVFGFAMADPGRNSLAAAALIFSFVGTGSSFLAFAIMAERREIADLRLPDKGFYYLGGLAEGTETLLFFLLFCLLPSYFPPLAWIFAATCALATLLRIVYGYRVLKVGHSA